MEEKTTVVLSTKSWHYKFLKWTLGKNSPTPQTMHNPCPYLPHNEVNRQIAEVIELKQKKNERK